MKFLSLIYIFGAIVSPVIAHTDPNVKEAVDAVNRDMSGAPTEMLARRPYRIPLSILDGTLNTCD
ncbi:hypothetical protein E4U60_000411 [Claviceps pazoutovae]|uniref:Uncharacterized protein n=1 Tax=Claviceps pazoutovae TaxID=1649127 RepID=A0A9P7ME70_9HYPO|nr:hypothetical protein E4U60_000411 [Claviceps pazoutovae]